MKPRARHHQEYVVPGVDSPRAKAQAVLFLVSARSIDHVTAEGLARQCRLKVPTAAGMLAIEKRRRAE